MANDTLKKYVAMKKTVEDAQTAASKAEGGLSQVKSQIKRDFGCSSLGETKRRLTELRTKAAAALAAFTKAFTAYKDKWETDDESEE